jgi:cytochrome b561
MGTRAARALHLALFLIGVVLYVVFVLPRWWVLTGDIPSTLATTGRIAAGLPIALAALPVMQILQAGLRSKPPAPEISLRLRAWAGVLHVIAGVLILLAALVEIWLSLEAGGPWVFGVYGAAGAIAILAFLALYLSFVAEKPPAEPKPAKPAKVKKAKTEKTRVEKKPRGKKRATTAAPTAEEDGEAESPADDTETTPAAEEAELAAETPEPIESATETVGIESAAETAGAETAPAVPATPGLRNKRPVGKSRLRPGRKG